MSNILTSNSPIINESNPNTSTSITLAQKLAHLPLWPSEYLSNLLKLLSINTQNLWHSQFLFNISCWLGLLWLTIYLANYLSIVERLTRHQYPMNMSNFLLSSIGELTWPAVDRIEHACQPACWGYVDAKVRFVYEINNINIVASLMIVRTLALCLSNISWNLWNHCCRAIRNRSKMVSP